MTNEIPEQGAFNLKKQTQQQRLDEIKRILAASNGNRSNEIEFRKLQDEARLIKLNLDTRDIEDEVISEK